MYKVGEKQFGMIECYILFAVVCNIIVDLLVWKEVRIMRISHQAIMNDTNALLEGFREFTQTLGPALELHAKKIVKSFGYYSNKGEEAAEGQIDSLQSTLEALGPLANLVSSTKSSSAKSGGSKYHV